MVLNQHATLAELRLPAPHAGQIIVRNGARRFNWLAAGRRWRKTTLVMAIAAEAALAGQRILWGAPVFDQVRVGWSELRHGASDVAVFNQSLMTATFPQSGGSIVFRSLDNPDNVRGHTADGVVIDECAAVDESAWNEVLRPMLLDTHGWLWAIGTPHGLNWFWKEHIAALDRSDSACWTAPTLGVRMGSLGLERAPHRLENPEIDLAEIQQLHATMPERIFAQEILSEFLSTEGGVFRGVSAVSRLQPAPPERGHQYVVGVDWGRVSDFTAISIIDATLGEQVALDRFSEIDFELQSERLHRWCDAYKPVLVVAEANSMGRPLVERLQTGYARLLDVPRKALPVWAFETTNASKAALVQSLGIAIEQGALSLLDDPVQQSELLGYEASVLPSGMLRYSAPPGAHDDTVISLGLAWLGAQRERQPQGVSRYGFNGAVPRRTSYALGA
jgi:hypothetical protein